MKYTLFFLFAFLCIIELNALNLSQKNPMKKSSQSRNSIHTKKETANRKIIEKNKSNRPSSPIKKPTNQIKKSTDPIKKITDPIKKNIVDPIKKKVVDPIKKEIIDPIKKKILDQIKKNKVAPIKKRTTGPIKRRTTGPIKGKTTGPIKGKTTSPIKGKTTGPIKRRTTDPIKRKTTGPIKGKTTDPIKRKTTGPIKRKTTYPIMKSTRPTNRTTIIKKKTTVPNNKTTRTIAPVKKTTFPKNKNKDNAKKVNDFVKSKLGCGYAYGSEGQTLSPDLLKRFKKKFGKNVKDSTNKWMNIECYDCSGLVMKALKEAGINVHHSAHWTWTEDMKKRGDIKDIPNDKLCLVFRKGKSGEMVHIGVYLGNGKVIEAKGADYGVVETDLKGSSWTNWGVPEGLE